MLRSIVAALLVTISLGCVAQSPPHDTPTPTTFPSTSVVLAEMGKWVFHEEIDPIDDSVLTTVILDSDDGERRLGEPITLVVGCHKGSVNSFLLWGWYLGSDDYISVDVRWDDTPARNERWRVTGDSNIIPWPPRLASLGPGVGTNQEIFL